MPVSTAHRPPARPHLLAGTRWVRSQQALLPSGASQLPYVRRRLRIDMYLVPAAMDITAPGAAYTSRLRANTSSVRHPATSGARLPLLTVIIAQRSVPVRALGGAPAAATTYMSRPLCKARTPVLQAWPLYGHNRTPLCQDGTPLRQQKTAQGDGVPPHRHPPNSSTSSFWTLNL